MYEYRDSRTVYEKEELPLSDYSKNETDYLLVMAITTDMPVITIRILSNRPSIKL